MALCAGKGRSQPDSRSRVDAIDQDFKAIFFGVNPAFLINHGVAVKAGGDPLIEGRSRKHIASNLLDRELIEGEVPVESVDYPITVFPHDTRMIRLIPVRVGIARQVKPWPRPPFTIVG